MNLERKGMMKTGGGKLIYYEILNYFINETYFFVDVYNKLLIIKLKTFERNKRDVP